MSDTILVVSEPEVTVVAVEDPGQPPTLVVVSAPGPQGPPGPGGSSVVHNQTVASAIWTIPHGLGYLPNWYVVETATGAQLDGSRTDPDVDTTIFDFDGVLFSGVAYGS